MKRPKAAFLALFAAGALLLAACGGGGTTPAGDAGSPAPGQYSRQDTVILAGEIGSAVTLDPQVAYETPSVSAATLMYQRLVKFPAGNTETPVGDAAESWDMSPDGLHWTFHLKKGIKFSTGRELTADDVVYTFVRAVSIPNDPAAWLVTQLGIDDTNVKDLVKAVDPYTVTIDLPEPFSPGAFLAVMANTVVGIVDSQEVQANEKDGDFGTGWLYNHSAGSGPYVLKDWTKDVQMEFVANANYVEGEPAIKRVIWKHIPEASARLDMLRTGEADIAENLTATQVESVQNDPNLKVFKAPAFSLTYVGMDVKNVPCLAKAECRNAIKYAIDYEGIVQKLLKGMGAPLQVAIPQGIFGYSDQVYFQRDVAKAKEFLAQAGYPNGFEVELLTSNGTVAGGIPAGSLANVIKANLADIGITVNIRQLESAQMYTEYRAHKVQMILAAWGMDYPDPQSFAAPFGDYQQKSLIWRLQDEDQALSDLVQRAAKLENTPERAALYAQFNDLLAETGPFAILYQPYEVRVYSGKLQNFVYDAVNGVAYWQMKKNP
ncbi:MAG: ABC transporter substrate-binding protein [Bacillota bacterium]|nr:ABC transporter substrate-binding protein [Bacillota bacterium]